MGGIVPVINVEGIKPGELVLDGPTVAKIFLGAITKWDDEAIKKLNPDAKLPSSAIAVVHRSDGSGTTYNFTYYLSAVSEDWKTKVGTEKAVEWPVGIGAKGNEGVANNVGQTKGSIGYVEYAYAKQNKMTYTKMVNKDGKTVEPTAATFAAAASHEPESQSSRGRGRRALSAFAPLQSRGRGLRRRRRASWRRGRSCHRRELARSYRARLDAARSFRA